MKYIAINTKGGAGKSTFASQILSAYLKEKNKEKLQSKEKTDEKSKITRNR